MSQPIIEVSGISKKYRLGQIGMTSLRDDLQRLGRRLRGQEEAPNERDFWALRDVSFDIQPGEIIGIIGRNGAGKSTLLKILSRITEPTTGEIVMRGRVGSLLEVGTGFHPELSGRDNVFLNGAILGMRKDEIARKFDEIVEFAEIGKFIDTPVKRYSSGMYVKLAFAIAAHLEPEILIVDEVLAVGDAQFQKKCIGRMQEISKGHGRTILFVSHSMTTIRRLCERCVVLSQGRSLGMMAVDQAIELYADSGVASQLEIDLSQRHRDWGTEGRLARILSAKVTSPNGLRFNEPFSIRFRLRIAEPLSDLMLGIGFNTIDGGRILSMDSDGNGKTFSLTPGEHEIEIGIDRLPLHPAPYSLCAAVMSGKFSYDCVDGFALWEVGTSTQDWEGDRGFGGCRMTPKVVIS